MTSHSPSAARKRIGLSEREYAANVGVSRGALRKARRAGRLVFHPDGSIDAAASDLRRMGDTPRPKANLHSAAADAPAGDRCPLCGCAQPARPEAGHPEPAAPAASADGGPGAAQLMVERLRIWRTA
jgi:hypothetical protein